MNNHFLYSKKELVLLEEIDIVTDKQKESFFDKFLASVFDDNLSEPVDIQFTKYLNNLVAKKSKKRDKEAAKQK